VFRAGSDDIDDLKQRVIDGVSKLKGLDIGDELAIEILGQLIHGKKTLTEICEGIYGLGRSEEGFQSCYTKVRREIRRLESRGLVSRKLFGNNKPFRLTQHAIINLARIGGEEQQLPIIPKIDAIAYLATFGLSLLIITLAMGFYQLSEMGTLGLFGGFCLLLGISICEILRALRRVF
jgi:hypothetical protein